MQGRVPIYNVSVHMAVKTDYSLIHCIMQGF